MTGGSATNSDWISMPGARAGDLVVARFDVAHPTGLHVFGDVVAFGFVATSVVNYGGLAAMGTVNVLVDVFQR